MGWEMYAALAVGLLFAMNIGGSGAASAMGAAYGGRAIGSRAARALVAVFALAGAVGFGGHVVGTIGHGLVPAGELGPTVVLIVLTTAMLTLAAANWIGVPLSTSEVAVGAVVGAGLALGQVEWSAIVRIVIVWAALPLTSLGLCYWLGRKACAPSERFLDRRGAWGRRALRWGLIAAGCFQAFAGGMNNVANALGPLVAAHVLDTPLGLWLGGAAMAAGSVAFGRRVLHTNGRGVAHLSTVGATYVVASSGALVVAASVLGIPVPLTQTMTVGILGLGWGQPQGRVNLPVVLRVVRVWTLSPLLAMSLSYLVVGATTHAWRDTSPVLGLMLTLGCVSLALLARELSRRTPVAES